MLKVNNLAVSYRQNGRQVRALKGINLELEAGFSHALIGPSGCGKSTLLYTLAGLLKPEEGEITLNPDYISDPERDIALILQEYGLLPWQSVWKNTVLGLKIRGKTEDKYKERILQLLEELEIIDYREHYPSQLSGGQRQRVAIARALSLNPRLLLMDEPFSSLDALTREQIQVLFLKLWEKYRMTVMLVTHSIEEAVFLGQKIIVLSNGPGKVVEVIENTHFAREDWRESESFFKQCQLIRSILKRGAGK